VIEGMAQYSKTGRSLRYLAEMNLDQLFLFCFLSRP